LFLTVVYLKQLVEVLTFHSRSEAKSEKSSNVIDFVLDEEIFKNSFNKIIKEESLQLKSKYKKWLYCIFLLSYE
jgi:hypothetical protein